MTQLDLILTPPTLKAESPVAIERKRLNAAARRVLAYLQMHEWAVNVDLARPEVGGNRAVGRFDDLRNDGWIIAKRHISGGKWAYKLLGRKDQAVSQ